MTDTRPGTETLRHAGLLTPVHLGPSAEATIRFAAALAGAWSCRLIGVAADEIELPYFGDSAGVIDAVLVENARAVVDENLVKAETLFRRCAGAVDVDWRCAVDQPRSFALAQARAADLVVVARQGPGDPALGRMGVAPDGLVMELGRPILVVPPGCEVPTARRIVIAWKDTREARRAVLDALPLLRRADLVSVLAVGTEAADTGAQDVCGYLARHGIAARAVLRPDSGEYVVDEITSLVQQQRADLIVAGAYGHSRMREWIFGGVTRDLIETTPVCCLMSH